MKIYLERVERKRQVAIHVYNDEVSVDTIVEYYLEKEGETFVIAKRTIPNTCLGSNALMVLPLDIFEKLSMAMIQEADSRGMKNTKEYKIEGQLEAKEGHIKDLQSVMDKLFSITTNLASK